MSDSLPTRPSDADSASTGTTRFPTGRGRGLRWLARLALYLLVPYLGVSILLALFQRSLIYYPTTESLDVASWGLPAGRARDVTTRTQDQLDLRGWLVLAGEHELGAGDAVDLPASGTRPLVLYFGGNAGHRGYRVGELKLLNEAGADVLIIDYRGYGDSPGTPSEEGLALDAEAAWRLATDAMRVEPQRIVLYGESLGGGVATRLASDMSLRGTPPGGLILRSTFNSLPEAAAVHFPWLPVRRVLVDRYPSDQRIGRVTCAVLQIHGRRDTIVPCVLGEKLFAATPERSSSGVPKRYVELADADHNDVLATSGPLMRQAIRDFLASIEVSR